MAGLKRGLGEFEPLSILFFVNGIVAFLAGVALIFFPDKVTYGMTIGVQANYLYNLLAAYSFSLSALSFFALSIHEGKSLKVPLATLIGFHGLASVAAIIVLIHNADFLAGINLAVHAVFFALYLVFGMKILRG